MGLFSKKDYICNNCKKKFQARLSPIDGLCDECYDLRENEKRDLQQYVLGYVEYKKIYDAFSPEYTPDEMRQIRQHRDAILDKYKISNGISRDELARVNKNFKSLSEEEAVDIFDRICHSLTQNTIGALFTNNFFAPTKFAGTIVDAKDIFAICFCSDYNIKSEYNEEIILCGVFTNDPYIPAFPIVFTGKTGKKELFKSKAGREEIKQILSEHCPNLKYPICDVKEMKKIIKNEQEVNGNIDKEKMLDGIFNVSVSTGVFNTKNLFSDALPMTTEMLNYAGYVAECDVIKILQMDISIHSQYWEKVADIRKRKEDKKSILSIS